MQRSAVWRQTSRSEALEGEGGGVFEIVDDHSGDITRSIMVGKRNESVGSVKQSSGNVFADLELPNPEEHQTKARLAFAINRIIEQRGLTQSLAARQLGINQPKVSALSHYRLDGFSVERLMLFLNALGQDVEIVICEKGRSRRSGRIMVTAA